MYASSCWVHWLSTAATAPSVDGDGDGGGSGVGKAGDGDKGGGTLGTLRGMYERDALLVLGAQAASA